MQISVTGHHIDVTDALRNYVESKFERLERHFDQVTDVPRILSISYRMFSWPSEMENG